MKVYVASQGVYSDRGVIGVYDSIERAIGDLSGHVGERWTVQTAADGSRSAHNGLDWEDSISVEEYTLTDTGPLRSVEPNPEPQP